MHVQLGDLNARIFLQHGMPLSALVRVRVPHTKLTKCFDDLTLYTRETVDMRLTPNALRLV